MNNELRITKVDILNHWLYFTQISAKNEDELSIMGKVITWLDVCCCDDLPPPMSEYTLMCPSNEQLEITAGLRGHHCTSKLHWLAVGNS